MKNIYDEYLPSQLYYCYLCELLFYWIVRYMNLPFLSPCSPLPLSSFHRLNYTRRECRSYPLRDSCKSQPHGRLFKEGERRQRHHTCRSHSCRNVPRHSQHPPPYLRHRTCHTGWLSRRRQVLDCTFRPRKCQRSPHLKWCLTFTQKIRRLQSEE